MSLDVEIKLAENDQKINQQNQSSFFALMNIAKLDATEEFVTIPEPNAIVDPELARLCSAKTKSNRVLEILGQDLFTSLDVHSSINSGPLFEFTAKSRESNATETKSNDSQSQSDTSWAIKTHDSTNSDGSINKIPSLISNTKSNENEFNDNDNLSERKTERDSQRRYKLRRRSTDSGTSDTGSFIYSINNKRMNNQYSNKAAKIKLSGKYQSCHDYRLLQAHIDNQRKEALQDMKVAKGGGQRPKRKKSDEGIHPIFKRLTKIEQSDRKIETKETTKEQELLDDVSTHSWDGTISHSLHDTKSKGFISRIFTFFFKGNVRKVHPNNVKRRLTI